MGLKARHWDRIGNGGLAFTELGAGTAPLGNLYRPVSEDEAHAVLETAWAGGVRYFDTAPLYGYGLAETRLNRFLRDKPRDAYVLSTKIGRLLRAVPPDRRDGVGKWFDVPSRAEVYDYSYDGVMRSLEFSLERLGVDRLDILFAHDLDVFNHGSWEHLESELSEFVESGYRALRDMRDEGVITAFGAGVNEWEPCQWLAERGDFDLFLLAGRYTLLEQDAIETLLPTCAARGIGVVIGGAFNSGILATGPTDGAFYNYEPAPPEIRERVSRIEGICRNHRVRLADAALRFPLLHPVVVSVVAGAQAPSEMDASLRAMDADIPSGLWEELKAESLMRPEVPV